MRRVVALVIALVALQTQTALAWDPFAGDELDAGPSAPAPDPAPFVVPEGLYAVTDVYAGDVVVTSGDTTTFATETVHETPGTYARVVDVVGSGSASAFDGASFNGRASLPDGRPVAGTYYEDFVLTAQGFLSVNIVFFQDDSAVRGTSVPPAVTAPPLPVPTETPNTPRVTGPIVTGPIVTPAPTPAPAPATRDTETTVSATAGVALGPSAPVLASIEVLRGRTVHLWPRAFVNGLPASVRSWRLISGGADLMTRVAGGAAEPCDAVWLTPTAEGASAVLRFEVTTDAAPGRVMVATVAVAVRSPALQR